MSVDVISFQTSVKSTFAISGVPSRDKCQITNVKWALEQDALTKLHQEVEQYLETSGREGLFWTGAEVDFSEEELRAPTFVYLEDNSLTRIPGLYEVSGVAVIELAAR